VFINNSKQEEEKRMRKKSEQQQQNKQKHATTTTHIFCGQIYISINTRREISYPILIKSHRKGLSLRYKLLTCMYETSVRN